LVDVVGIESIGASFNGKATYHDSCHLLRGLGIYEQPRKLIKNIKGLQFVEMKNSDRCCGFGGAFSIKYPEISIAILDEKVKTILETGADIVTGCDIGCLMNIQGRLNRKRSSVKTVHIAQLLAGH
ncbi:MAG: (Fe-S)-binding protein, partial [Desulfobacterales bacterium]